MKICVFGAASNEIDKSYMETVENFGAMIAKDGHSLVFGAGGHGLMGACARGVKKENGYIYGVIPAFFRDEKIEKIFDECDELIYTETMAQRKTKMEDLADAFVIVPGGMGTFEEFFEVLTLRQLGRHNKPIFILNTNGYYDPLEELMQHALDQGFIRSDHHALYTICATPQDILDQLK